MIIFPPPNLPPAPLVFSTLVQAASPPTTSLQLIQNITTLSYNVIRPPNLQQSQDLQTIVDEVVSLAAVKGLPTYPLSITLIDIKSGEVAGYKQEQLRYPASVVKLFWMAAIYDQIEKGILSNEQSVYSDLYKMIQYSNNESASRILDIITDTKSGGKLQGENYQNWLKKRNGINQIFQAAGYEGININQKVYPVPYLNLYLPKGRDLQMRGNPKKPLRNQMTTAHAARLLYEIFTNKSVSPEASQKMAKLLTRDLSQEDRSTPEEELLFGKYLPDDVYLASKAGWTSTDQHEAAYVSTRDGETAYILVVFGSDRAYARNKDILSQMSRLVFNRMSDGQRPAFGDRRN